MVMNTDGNKYNRLREALRNFAEGAGKCRSAHSIRPCGADGIGHTRRLSIAPAATGEQEAHAQVEEQMRAASRCGKVQAAHVSREYFLLLLVAGCRYLHRQRQSA